MQMGSSFPVGSYNLTKRALFVSEVIAPHIHFVDRSNPHVILRQLVFFVGSSKHLFVGVFSFEVLTAANSVARAHLFFQIVRVIFFEKQMCSTVED